MHKILPKYTEAIVAEKKCLPGELFQSNCNRPRIGHQVLKSKFGIMPSILVTKGSDMLSQNVTTTFDCYHVTEFNMFRFSKQQTGHTGTNRV